MKRKIIVFYIIILGLSLLFNASCSCEMTPSIYYLNFKTEQDAAWQKIAKEYEKQKGVKVNVVTAASGNYEATLTSELNKTNAPTLFQINGEIGYNTWKEYILDLSNEEVTQELISEDYAIIEDGKTYGIGYVYEGYGIIVNKKLLNKTPYKIDDIVSLEKLKEVTEYITKNKDSLNFSAFTSPGLDSSSSWRFTGHLLNIPLYYEFKEREVISQPQTVDGRYLSSSKALWELYINNSTVEPNKLSSKTSTDSLSDFILEKACFYQNGTWEYENIKTIGDENIGFIPIYAGVDDENEGFSCGCENYFVVNKLASEEKVRLTVEFLNWLVTDEFALNTLANDMGFVSPFKKAKETKNILSTIIQEKQKENVEWVFRFTPNVESYRANLVSALALYSENQTSENWLKVANAVTNKWEEEYNKQNQKKG